ncbi:hypothetical protein GCM10017673_37720 [Streptosporangium violaceochromogenes]|nr:hypothetical protein GCM10017673_37720 [Streptosporangium violaceochromogenes]
MNLDPIPARDLRPGMVVSRPEWAGGAPVRILRAYELGDTMAVLWQDAACRQLAQEEHVPADTLVVLNPRTPATTWWRRAEPRVERAATVAGLTALTLLSLTGIARAAHHLAAGTAGPLDAARVAACSALLGLCIYLYRSTRRDT